MTLFRTVLAIFREIFDEAAYERFCAREGVEVSRESYVKFLRETDAARDQKVKCC
jgi:hypothetical protein